MREIIDAGKLPDGRALRLRLTDDSEPRPQVDSEFEDWGEFDPQAKGMRVDRWQVEVISDDQVPVIVGNMTAHPVWYGPSAGSDARNIGIGVLESARGQGIGWRAQAALAAELHQVGVVRVEASTDVTNIAEQRALERAGFVCEGVLRSAQVRADGRHDLQVWSHLA